MSSEEHHEQEPGSGFELLRDPRAIRALAHPTRHRIFAAAVDEPVSAKELAARFEQPVGRISYHVRALAEVGLLRVVSQTRRRGATETHYRAVATLEVSDEALREVDPQIRAVLAESAVRNIGDDAVEAFKSGAAEARDSLVARTHFVMTKAGRARFRAEVRAMYERLAEIEQELWEAGCDSEEPMEEMSLALIVYPGDVSSGRNRAFVLGETLTGERQIDTIPPIGSSRG